MCRISRSRGRIQLDRVLRLNGCRSHGSGESEESKRVQLVVLVGAAEGEAGGLAAETVALGDPTFAGCLAGVSLKLPCYHICEPEIKEEIDEAVYDEQISMMEMVLDVDDICEEMNAIREQVAEA